MFKFVRGVTCINTASLTVESSRLEYKRELTDGLEKEAVAFLNSREGGAIYIGVDPSGSTVGVPNGDEIQLAVKDRLKNNILPSCLGLFDVLVEQREGLNVIKINLAGGTEKPYYLKKHGMSEKGCFMRIGSASEPMPVRLIEEYFAKRTRNSIGKIRSPRQDLTFEQLRIYYNEAGFELGEKFIYNLELLTESDEFNYAAYLMADNNGNSIQVAKYRGLDRFELIESSEYGYCSLIKSCKQVLDRLELENKTYNRITSKERINTRFWNALALREAVVNAIVHNDYTNEAVPKFEIFDDRIEITSAGSIPPGVEREEFFLGYSIPRNKIIMRIFKDLDMVEYLGSGLPRILKAYSQDSYIFTGNFIRTVFNTYIPKEQSATTTDKSSVKGSVKSSVKIVELMKENAEITISMLADDLGLTTRAVEKNVAKLQAAGTIRRIGADKGGHWEIVE